MAERTIKPLCLHCGVSVPRMRNKYCSKSCKDAASTKVELRDGLKQCTKCDTWKPINYYNKGNDRYGFSHICRECDNAKTKAYDIANADKRRDYRKNNYQRRKVFMQAWRSSHADYNKNYYASRREWHLKRLKEWQRANPEQVRVQRDKRRALRVQAQGSYTSNQWQALKAEHGNRCLRCGKHESEAKITPDHIIPLSRGGSNDISNIQPLCSSCNSSKGTKIINYRDTLGEAA